MAAAKTPSQVVFVIDDDASMRDALSRLLNAVGLTVQTFASPGSFSEEGYLMFRNVQFWTSGCLA